MDDEGKAGEGMQVQTSMPTMAEVPPPNWVSELPQNDPDLFSEPAKQRINADRQAGMDADDKAEQWTREGIPPVAPDGGISRIRAGRASIPLPMVPAGRTDCPHCGGRGFMPGINDHLRESVALLTSQGDRLTDAVVRDFYVALFREQPALIAIFPGDPTKGDFGTDDRGAKQRELLLGALAALADLYDPTDPARMEQLDAALKRFGRAHASFTRPDGTVRGATLDEYKAVKDALFTTLVKAAADKWKPEYTEAWTQAYDYAAAAMLVEQFRSGFTAPRYTRGNSAR